MNLTNILTFIAWYLICLLLDILIYGQATIGKMVSVFAFFSLGWFFGLVISKLINKKDDSDL